AVLRTVAGTAACRPPRHLPPCAPSTLTASTMAPTRASASTAAAAAAVCLASLHRPAGTAGAMPGHRAAGRLPDRPPTPARATGGRPPSRSTRGATRDRARRTGETPAPRLPRGQAPVAGRARRCPCNPCTARATPPQPPHRHRPAWHPMRMRNRRRLIPGDRVAAPLRRAPRGERARSARDAARARRSAPGPAARRASLPRRRAPRARARAPPVVQRHAPPPDAA
uniref:Uncharacterized protein n=1 Tax=Petromyzon marinus TaxID=7757 RepID=S4RY71_PETMA